MEENIVVHQGGSGGFSAAISTPFCCSSGSSFASWFGASGVMVMNSFPSERVPRIILLMMTTLDTSPASTCLRKSLYSTSCLAVFFVEK